MGNKNTIESRKMLKNNGKMAIISEKDIKFFTRQTGISKTTIMDLYKKFYTNNPEGTLNKTQFKRLYAELRTEPVKNLDEISDHVFRSFDIDNSGTLSFNEFMLGFSFTSRGDQKSKLEYAFDFYDIDGNGYLTIQEICDVIKGMLELLDARKTHHNPTQLATDCLKVLDTNRDGKVSKDEFVDGLLKNYSLRALMSPFN